MKKRILIVDDTDYMRLLLSKILIKAGYEIAGKAATGKEAIKLVKEAQPDLVILDMILPDISGLEVLKFIKAENPKIKVVIVSAVDPQVIVDEALSLGALGYFVKPYVEDKILQTLEEAWTK